jgi:hypothetical protein
MVRLQADTTVHQETAIKNQKVEKVVQTPAVERALRLPGMAPCFAL